MPSSLVLYVGINKPFVFDKFTTIFHRVLVAHPWLRKAQEFSQGIGVILTVKSGTSKYLAVSWLSDFPHDNTHILYGSHTLLEITNIHEAETMKSHKVELEMFNKFQRMLENTIVAWDEKMVD
eukprot:500385_1